MKVCFLTAGPLTWASSRMRAYWPAAYMDAVVLPLVDVDSGREPLPQADVYVFQKLYSQRVRDAIPAGALVVWDVCDPLWWFDPEGSEDALRNVDAVTVSTLGLASDFADWQQQTGYGRAVPVYYVHDCIEPSHFPIQAVHTDHEPIRFIWFGIYVNRVALHAAQANLERLVANGYKIQLTIMDERPDIPHVFSTRVSFPVYFVEWSLEIENEVIAAHDIALLPPYPGPWGSVKSKNKNVTAWACNVPTAAGLDYGVLKWLVSSAGSRHGKVELNSSQSGCYTAEAIAHEWQSTFRFIQDDLSSHQRESAVFVEDTAAFATA